MAAPETGLCFEVHPYAEPASRLRNSHMKRTNASVIRPQARRKKSSLRNISGGLRRRVRCRRTYLRSKTTHRRDVMAAEISYYAIVDDYTSPTNPAGLTLV